MIPLILDSEFELVDGFRRLPRNVGSYLSCRSGSSLLSRVDPCNEQRPHESLRDLTQRISNNLKTGNLYSRVILSSGHLHIHTDCLFGFQNCRVPALNAKRARSDRAFDRDQLGKRFDTDEKRSREYRHSYIHSTLEILQSICLGDQFVSEGQLHGSDRTGF